MAIALSTVTESPHPSAGEVARRLEAIPPLPIHTRWAVIVGTGCFLDAFTTLAVAAALTVLMPALHMDFSQGGLLISASFGGMLVGAIGFGAASERWGRRRIFVLAVGLFGLLSIVSAFAWSFASLFWLRLVQGLGLGGAVPVAAALLAESLPARVRGRTFSLTYALLFAFGYVVAPLAGMACIRGFGPLLGWRVLFGIAGLALPFALAARRMLPESPRWLAAHGRWREADALLSSLEAAACERGITGEALVSLPVGAQPHSTGLSEVFRGRFLGRTILVWTLFFTIYFVQYGLNAWLPALYVKIGGLPAQRALGLAVVNGCMALGAAIVFGLTVDKIGRRRWFLVGFALSIAGALGAILALSVLHVTAWPVLFSAAIPLTIGTAVNAGLIYLYAPELFPTRMRAWATSTGSAASRLGSILAPMAIGMLLQARLGLVSVFALLAAASLVGLLAIATAGIETQQRALEELAN